MAKLKDIVQFCDELTRKSAFKDYPGAYNGLQIENSGKVTKIGASVDAGFESFERAISRGIDLLFVHHGPFWGPTLPLTGLNYQKFRAAFEGNLAVYGSHLPLDAHPEIGNNVLLALEIGLEPSGRFGMHEGEYIGWYADTDFTRGELESRLRKRFPDMIALNHGTDTPKRVGIITGSGGSVIPELGNDSIDTLITGECSQHHFVMTQELGINLFLCGHYATEVFAVQALAAKVAEQFDLEWEFVDTGCPL